MATKEEMIAGELNSRWAVFGNAKDMISLVRDMYPDFNPLPLGLDGIDPGDRISYMADHANTSIWIISGPAVGHSVRFVSCDLDEAQHALLSKAPVVLDWYQYQLLCIINGQGDDEPMDVIRAILNPGESHEGISEGGWAAMEACS